MEDALGCISKNLLTCSRDRRSAGMLVSVGMCCNLISKLNLVAMMHSERMSDLSCSFLAALLFTGSTIASASVSSIILLPRSKLPHVLRAMTTANNSR